jgi:FkbM family methyltransferase
MNPSSPGIRNDQLAQDLALWPSRTKQLILANDPSAKRVAGTYSEYVRRGEFEYLDLFIDPARISVDVGANYGQYSMKLAISSKGCLSVEPVQSLGFVGDLLPDNCVFRNVAAGAARGSKLLRIPQREGMLLEALSTMADHNQLRGYEVIEQMTEVFPVDDLVRDAFPGEKVGFIKIDVEGLENEVLAGCLETIKAYKPNIKVELYGNASVGTVHDFLAALGYRGLFFFERRLFDAGQFSLSVHRSPENEWHTRNRAGRKFDPSLYVTDFYFIPTGALE